MSNHRVRAVGIIVKKNQVLLMYRLKKGHQYFAFPGGGVELGETVTQTLEREIKEETTLTIKIIKLLYHHLYDNGQEQFFYLCSPLAGKARLGSGPEFKDPERGIYKLVWKNLTDLEKFLLYPLEIRDWLIEDLKTGFKNTPREAKIKIFEIRHNL